jgi:pimeloyl-ACP methyl ester carboxylesterase
MTKLDIKIQSDNLVLHGVIDTPLAHFKVGILFLHGGGHSQAERYGDVQSYFSDKNITSLAFSFRGCGLSEGIFEESNLKDRLVDAESALKSFKEITGLTDSQIFLWGSSMGGHIAARITSTHSNIKGLILQSAAAYGQNAESQSFGPKFSDAINTENNWTDSLAFSSLSSFSNRTLLLYGENDTTIPEQVKETYSKSAKYIQKIIISGYGHKMLKPETNIEKNAWKEMVKSALDFIHSN